jgi:GNAT superfamily N-acetyltransferase
LQNNDSLNFTFEKLSKKHKITNFDCGVEALNKFIQTEALQFQEEGLGVTYLAFDDNQLIGFVTISMADVRTQKMELDHSPVIRIENLSALQIGQLAINKVIQRRGIGTKLVGWCMSKAIEYSKTIGCRSLVLNAIPESIGFYKHLGFTELKDQRGRVQKITYLVVPKELLKE